MRTITHKQWLQVERVLDIYIQDKVSELQQKNASDTEWQEVVELEGTLRDIQMYVLMK